MKPITCLEATWYRNNSVSVRPFLETLKLLEGVSYTHYPCNTVKDLKFLLNRPANGIIYIAMHGHAGSLSPKGGTVSLLKVAEMMETRFKGSHVHFASCQTLNTSYQNLSEFKKLTGVSIVSGYTREVDWIEGYSTDMLLLSKAQNYVKPSYLIKHMTEKFPDLVSATGLYME